MVATTFSPVETWISAPSWQASPLKFPFKYLSQTQEANLKECKIPGKSAVLYK